MSNTNVLFTVTGKGDFPTPMLQMDECWPADTVSAMKMLKPFIVYNGPHPVELQRTIHMRMASNWGTLSGPSVARWEKAGWTVVVLSAECDGQDITQDVQRECALAYIEENSK